MRRKTFGFTLMELLIVIGVLGILAVGLLAAIDPFEQLKKARDTNTRNATIELLSAWTRFYSIHGAFPWNMPAYGSICGRATGQVLDGWGGIGTYALSLQDSRLANCAMGSLVPDGEIKSTFMDGLGVTNIFVGSDVSDLTNLIVCFEPESKSGRSDLATKYLVNTVDGGWYAITEQTGTPPLDACPRQLGDCAQCFR